MDQRQTTPRDEELHNYLSQVLPGPIYKPISSYPTAEAIRSFQEDLAGQSSQETMANGKPKRQIVKSRLVNKAISCFNDDIDAEITKKNLYAVWGKHSSAIRF